MRALQLIAALCVALAPVLASAQPDAAREPPAARLKALEATYPPWQHGDGGGAPDPGLVFTVPPVDMLADFHGRLDGAALVLFASGNYFFALGQLVAGFGDAEPRYRDRVFWETLPPGLLVKQIEAHGTVTSGNMTFTAVPDVYMAEYAASTGLAARGMLAAPVISFATNDLAIMVGAGNPAQVRGLADLARPDLGLAMPNPEFEGVARQIRASLVKAGGDDLAEAVYGAKVRSGFTVLTRIHHRQTPLLLMQGLVAAGVAWRSEALFQEEIGNPIGHVDIPEALNTTATYSAAMVTGAPHPDAAGAWLAFLRSERAFAILTRYGFGRPPP